MAAMIRPAQIEAYNAAYCAFTSWVMGCLHDPAKVQQYICWKFAGRLLDRVNTL